MRQNARYYKKHRVYNARGGRDYQDWEERLILAHKIGDVSLAKLLKRSLAAIQLKRSNLKRKIHE